MIKNGLVWDRGLILVLKELFYLIFILCYLLRLEIMQSGPGSLLLCNLDMFGMTWNLSI